MSKNPITAFELGLFLSDCTYLTIWTFFPSTCCRLHLLLVAGPGFPLPAGVPSGAREPGRRHLSAGLRRRPPRTHGESHLDPRLQVAGKQADNLWARIYKPFKKSSNRFLERKRYLSHRPVRARIFKRTFVEPRNRFQGMNSASLCSLAGRYDNPIPTLFLAPMDCLKIQALVT